MWVELRCGEADAQQRVSRYGGCRAGQQAPEAVGAVAGQFHLVGDLAEGGLNAVAPLGDDLLEDGRHLLALVFAGRDEHGSAAGGLLRGERLAVEPLIREQVTRRRPGFQQVGGDLALVHRRTHDAPGAHDPAALRRPSRWRTMAMVSSSASLQAGWGPGRAGMAIAPAVIKSWISTYT